MQFFFKSMLTQKREKSVAQFQIISVELPSTFLVCIIIFNKLKLLKNKINKKTKKVAIKPPPSLLVKPTV